MCDFKPGDELIYVGPGSGPGPCGLPINSVHTCRSLHVHPISDAIGVKVDARAEPVLWTSFRKVQRRDLSAWLKTSVGNTDKLDKRQPKKVRA